MVETLSEYFFLFIHLEDVDGKKKHARKYFILRVFFTNNQPLFVNATSHKKYCLFLQYYTSVFIFCSE